MRLPFAPIRNVLTVATVALVAACSHFETHNDLPTDTVYVQASKGSFNDQAVQKLYAEHQQETPELVFSGTPKQTFNEADKSDGLAFVALRNTLVPGHLVESTVSAVRHYEPKKLIAAQSLRIRMCLLRKKGTSSIPLTQIASHPAALEQISMWKKGKDLKEIPEPQGTAYAASLLADGKLGPETGVIAGCAVADLYPQLEVEQKSIQDINDNFTLFGLMTVKRRIISVTEDEARKELNAFVKRASAIALGPQ